MGAPKKFRMLAALRPLRKSFSGADASRLAAEGTVALAWGSVGVNPERRVGECLNIELGIDCAVLGQESQRREHHAARFFLQQSCLVS